MHNAGDLNEWSGAQYALLWEAFHNLPLESPLLEVGSGTNFDHRNLFAQRYEYQITDPWPDIPVDAHYDVESLPYLDGTFGAVIMIDVLEHVSDPLQAVAQVYRVLRPRGHLFLTVPMFGPGEHGDYRRFTYCGLEGLITGAGRRWASCEIVGVGDARLPGDPEGSATWSSAPKPLGYTVHAVKGADE